MVEDEKIDGGAHRYVYKTIYVIFSGSMIDRLDILYKVKCK